MRKTERAVSDRAFQEKILNQILQYNHKNSESRRTTKFEQQQEFHRKIKYLTLEFVTIIKKKEFSLRLLEIEEKKKARPRKFETYEKSKLRNDLRNDVLTRIKRMAKKIRNLRDLLHLKILNYVMTCGIIF